MKAIRMITTDGKHFDNAEIPDPKDTRLKDAEYKNKGVHYHPDDVAEYFAEEAKRKIDKGLVSHNINQREQIVTTANGLQVALIGLSTLVIACSKSSDAVLKQAAEPLLPFADNFLKARESGDMPVDVLGVESVCQKVIQTTVISGQVVRGVVQNKNKR